jgi:hypothetical protein
MLDTHVPNVQAVIFALHNKHLLKAVHADMDGLVAIATRDGIVFQA